jgi:hypothetical protein
MSRRTGSCAGWLGGKRGGHTGSGDLRHYLTSAGALVALPRRARSLAEHFTQIVAQRSNFSPPHLGPLRPAIDFHPWPASTHDTVDGAGNLTLRSTPNTRCPGRSCTRSSSRCWASWACIRVIPRNIYMKTDIPIAGWAHQAGTCRFGAEATSSLRVGDRLIGRLI